MIRQPICVLIGHVDHGKTSILDFIRDTSITKTEAGGITQKISAHTISLEQIKKITKGLFETLKEKITIPGILFIDSPGHEAFTNLRKRGGNLADIAILVISINEGLKPQTIEALEILKTYKTPFVIAANKIDLISGYRKADSNLLMNINKQSDYVKKELDDKLYKIVGSLSEHGFISQRFDRVDDFTKEVAIIPVSGKTGDGIPELIMVLLGLSQKYLEKNLKTEVKGPGKAIILEVRKEKGVGLILDTIVYDGTLKKNDTILIGGIEKPIKTKAKGLFIADQKLKPVKEVFAAASVCVYTPDTEGVIAGVPLRVANKDEEKIKKEIQEEIKEVLIETDKDGLIIKADSLGSLEALSNILKEKNIKIRRASIGDITKKDLMEACSQEKKIYQAILGFNVKQNDFDKDIKVINHDIIYKIIEDYEKWKNNIEKQEEENQLKDLSRPCKILIIPGYIFRQSSPAVVGVDVLAGTLKIGTILMKENGKEISEVKGIQEDRKNIQEAIKGKQVAISLPKAVIGRNLDEGDILYSSIKEHDFKKLKELKKFLNSDEIIILKEISEIKRKENSLWGV